MELKIFNEEGRANIETLLRVIETAGDLGPIAMEAAATMAGRKLARLLDDVTPEADKVPLPWLVEERRVAPPTLGGLHRVPGLDE